MRMCPAWKVVLALLIAVPAMAADRVIPSGIDPWRTKGDGRTWAQLNLPGGFFCTKSEPLNERVVFRGVPIATSIPGQLKTADTIVQRLDDAVFNKNGVAVTRVQVRAMTFESVAPIETACGLYTLKVALDGPQPITRMRIVQENAKGGSFVAQLGVNVKISFHPLNGLNQKPLEIRKKIRFQENAKLQWSFDPGRETIKHAGQLLVDTNGDRIPDSVIPGTTRNFAAGSSVPRNVVASSIQYDCHFSADECTHCPM